MKKAWYGGCSKNIMMKEMADDLVLWQKQDIINVNDSQTEGYTRDTRGSLTVQALTHAEHAISLRWWSSGYFRFGAHL